MAVMMVKILVTVFVVALAFHGSNVSAENHHVVGGAKNLDVGSWLSGRVFGVGDKILFNEEKMVELEGPDEFKTCDISNPIKMYTDGVVLDRAGTRYFASANLENCKNGLRIPIEVRADPTEHFDPSPEFEPPPQPWPVHPPPPPIEPSLAVNLNAISWVFFVGLVLCYVVGL